MKLRPPSWRNVTGDARLRLWLAKLPGLVHRHMRRIFRRWIYALTAFAGSVVLMWLPHADALDALWRSEQSLEVLRQQVAAPSAAVGDKSGSEAVKNASALVQVLDHLPGLMAQVRLWPTLQQTLARERLQLLSFRPVDDPMAAPLPSQAVALRLRGRFDDWVRAWSGMSEGAPVWSIDRVHIQPTTDSTAVEIDVLLRVWLRAGPDGPRAWQGQGAVGVPSAARTDAVFVDRRSAEQLASAGVLARADVTADKPAKSETMDSPDPADWSRAGLRLLGIWQEADTRHAILAFGVHWIWARVGQRVSLEGHWIEAIGDQAVNLRVGQGPVQVLNLEKGSR